MRRAIAPFILLLILLAGCETEKDPVEKPLDPSLLLTDGFCLVSNSRVVLNHYDIEYYDYGAHLIYLKSPDAFEEKFKKPGKATVYADSSRIYDLTLISQFASYIVSGPAIHFPNIFYPDYTVHIGPSRIYKPLGVDGNDPREDSRIVDALLKYGQFRHGLQCEIASIRYTSAGNVVLELELWNEDPVNYYYWDPDKLGMELYHYVTNGLIIKDVDGGQSYTHHVQSSTWAGEDPERWSLLESDSSVTLTLTYEQFDKLPSGNYEAYFEFPGPKSVENREDLDLEDGRIWLGDIPLFGEVVVE